MKSVISDGADIATHNCNVLDGGNILTPNELKCLSPSNLAEIVVVSRRCESYLCSGDVTSLEIT